jgi:hypothetical protein
LAMLPATLRRSGDGSSKLVDDRFSARFLASLPVLFMNSRLAVDP